MKTPLELSRSVGKIGLNENRVAAGDSCVVSGWGVTEVRTGTEPERL